MEQENRIIAVCGGQSYTIELIGRLVHLISKTLDYQLKHKAAGIDGKNWKIEWYQISRQMKPPVPPAVCMALWRYVTYEMEDNDDDYIPCTEIKIPNDNSLQDDESDIDNPPTKMYVPQTRSVDDMIGYGPDCIQLDSNGIPRKSKKYKKKETDFSG